MKCCGPACFWLRSVFVTAGYFNQQEWTAIDTVAKQYKAESAFFRGCERRTQSSVPGYFLSISPLLYFCRIEIIFSRYKWMCCENVQLSCLVLTLLSVFLCCGVYSLCTVYTVYRHIELYLFGIDSMFMILLKFQSQILSIIDHLKDKFRPHTKVLMQQYLNFSIKFIHINVKCDKQKVSRLIFWTETAHNPLNVSNLFVCLWKSKRYTQNITYKHDH